MTWGLTSHQMQALGKGIQALHGQCGGDAHPVVNTGANKRIPVEDSELCLSHRKYRQTQTSSGIYFSPATSLYLTLSILLGSAWLVGVTHFSSDAQSCPTLWDPMDCSMPGFPVHHQLPEPTQTHVHWVSDAIQPSHPLSFPTPPTFNLSQHQGLFQWVSSSH